MKKYVNGKLYDMTEQDKINLKNRVRRHNKTEDKIKELEKIIETLKAQQEEAQK